MSKKRHKQSICVVIRKSSQFSTIIFTAPGSVSSYGASGTHHWIQGRKSSAVHSHQVQWTGLFIKLSIFSSLTNCLVVMGKTTNFLLFCLSSAHFRGKCLSVIFRKFPMVRSRLQSPVFARTGEGACNVVWSVECVFRDGNSHRCAPFKNRSELRTLMYSSLTVCCKSRCLLLLCPFSFVVSWNVNYTNQVAAAAELPRPTFL